MESITGIDAYFHDTKMGRLELIEGQIEFSYDTEFIELGIELSPFHLPVSEGVKRHDNTAFDGLHGLFYDNLPDRYGRAAYDRFCADNDFIPASILDHLAYVGGSGIGALSFRPSSVDSELEVFKIIDAIHDSKFILNKIDTESVSRALLKSSQIGGAHPKFFCFYQSGSDTCYRGGDIAPKGYRHAIIKIAEDKPESRDESMLLEHCLTRLAGECGIDVPETEILENEHGSHLVSYRFDIDSEGYPIHTHSLCGLGHMDYRSSEYRYEDYLGTVFMLTKDARQVRDAFKRAVFNAAIHNTDDHTKNFSFLMNLEQNWTLSPHYDVLSCFEPGHTLRLGAKDSVYTRADFLRLAEEFNIPSDEAKSAMDEVVDALKSFMDSVKQHGIEGWILTAVKPLIERGISVLMKKGDKGRSFMF